MKALYFTIENINSGLFDSQVFNSILAVRSQNPAIKFTILVVNQPWNFFSAKKKLEQLSINGIKIIYLPLLPPLRWFSSGRVYTELYVKYLALVLRLFVDLKKYNIIHCRNYLPSLVIRNSGRNNFLFDVRSLHAYEYVQAKKIKEGSSNFKYWLQNEKTLLQEAGAVTAVSNSMIGYFKGIVDRPFNYCPIVSNYELIYFSKKAREYVRNDLKWKSNNIYVYSGSFGLYGINKHYLARLVKWIRTHDRKARFMFLISNPLAELISFLKENEIPPNLVFSKSVKLSELKNYLSAADIGIHALPPQLDSFTRLGTKVVEYWSAGLPVIINEYVGEAAIICNKYNLGKVISLDENTPKKQEEFYLDMVYKTDRERIRNVTKKIFSSTVVAKEYANIYTKFAK